MPVATEKLGMSRLDLIERARFVTDKPDEILIRLKGLVESGEIRLREMERFTTYKSPTISQVLSGTYEGDADKVVDALARYYRNWIARHAIVQTRVVEEIHSVMLLAWKRKEIALIRGPFGRGKTKAASRFAALHDFAVMVELSGVSSPTELLHRVASTLNIEAHMAGTRSDKLQAIIRALQRKPRLIVIDEADELRPKTLALLRDIHGEGTERCALVLIATERFNKILRNPDLGYLRRRITIKRDIGDIEFNEAREIVGLWPNNLDNQDLKAAWSWALRQYGVASLVALMKRAYDEMQMREKRKIDGECLEAAYGWLVD